MEERQKLFEIEKEKELYESKVDFFTEIAHEVRTPLTLIYHCLHCIYRMYYPDRGWHHLMVQTPQGETIGRTAKAV